MDRIERIPGVGPEREIGTSPDEDGLTSIQESIHCPTTQDCGGSEIDELDRIDIENFLDALAQVALSVAGRRADQGQGEDS